MSYKLNDFCKWRFGCTFLVITVGFETLSHRDLPCIYNHPCSMKNTCENSSLICCRNLNKNKFIYANTYTIMYAKFLNYLFFNIFCWLSLYTKYIQHYGNIVQLVMLLLCTKLYHHCALSYTIAVQFIILLNLPLRFRKLTKLYIYFKMHEPTYI